VCKLLQQTPVGASSLDPTGPLGYSPQMKIPGTLPLPLDVLFSVTGYYKGHSVLWFTCDLYWESRADFANFLCSPIIGLIIHLHSLRGIIIIPCRLLSDVCLKRICSLHTGALSALEVLDDNCAT